jgi:hypothetical protein
MKEGIMGQIAIYKITPEQKAKEQALLEGFVKRLKMLSPEERIARLEQFSLALKL